MQKRLHILIASLISLTALSAFGQRQELSISPIGFIRPNYQLIQYERYVDSRQSLTLSLGYNDYTVLKPHYRTDRFLNTRGAIGYRYYIPGLGVGEDLTIFGSARTVVDYSSLQLQADPRFSVSTDSLRVSGISLAPEILFGGKALLFNRVTLTGAVGMQYLFKLFSTQQITRNPVYWSKRNSEDDEDWQANRNTVTDFRRGWYPSVQVTVGVIFGKRPQASTPR